MSDDFEDEFDNDGVDDLLVEENLLVADEAFNFDLDELISQLSTMGNDNEPAIDDNLGLNELFAEPIDTENLTPPALATESTKKLPLLNDFDPFQRLANAPFSVGGRRRAMSMDSWAIQTPAPGKI